jgi:hypothetical protein
MSLITKQWETPVEIRMWNLKTIPKSVYTQRTFSKRILAAEDQAEPKNVGLADFLNGMNLAGHPVITLAIEDSENFQPVRSQRWINEISRWSRQPDWRKNQIPVSLGKQRFGKEYITHSSGDTRRSSRTRLETSNSGNHQEDGDLSS